MNEIRKILYDLGKAYGKTIDFYRPTDTPSDVLTGNSNYTATRYKVRKTIKLPTKIVALNFISPKDFNYGGYVDTSLLRVIISRDKTTYVPELRDYFVVDLQRYNIKQIITLEDRLGYFIIGSRAEGSDLNQVITLNISHDLALHQDVGHDI